MRHLILCYGKCSFYLFRVIGEEFFTSSIKVFIYSSQKCNVRWVMLSQISSMESDKEQFFPLCYFVYCKYFDKVIKLLRYSTIGCQIQGVYKGIWVYSDYIILLSPSRTGPTEMVKFLLKLLNLNLVQIFK